MFVLRFQADPATANAILNVSVYQIYGKIIAVTLTPRTNILNIL